MVCSVLLWLFLAKIFCDGTKRASFPLEKLQPRRIPTWYIMSLDLVSEKQKRKCWWVPASVIAAAAAAAAVSPCHFPILLLFLFFLFLPFATSSSQRQTAQQHLPLHPLLWRYVRQILVKFCYSFFFSCLSSYQPLKIRASRFASVILFLGTHAFTMGLVSYHFFHFCIIYPTLLTFFSVHWRIWYWTSKSSSPVWNCRLQSSRWMRFIHHKGRWLR